MSPSRADIAVPDQTGRVAVVTGATSGNGLAAARRLGFHGAEVVIAARNEAKAERVVRQLRSEVPNGAYRIEIVDLSSTLSIRDFAARLLHQGRPINTLINNAGVLVTPHTPTQLTEDGFELQWGTNFLAPYLLTSLLLPLFLDADRPRVINVASLAATRGKIDLSDLRGLRGARTTRAYANSKLALLLFTRELERRSRELGWHLSSIAAHPGWSATNLLASTLPTRIERAGASLGLQQSAQCGALSTLMAATDPAVLGGEYYGPTQRFGLVGHPGSVPWPKAALNHDTAGRLWEAAAMVVGASWPRVR